MTCSGSLSGLLMKMHFHFPCSKEGGAAFRSPYDFGYFENFEQVPLPAVTAWSPRHVIVMLMGGVLHVPV